MRVIWERFGPVCGHCGISMGLGAFVFLTEMPKAKHRSPRRRGGLHEGHS